MSLQDLTPNQGGIKSEKDEQINQLIKKQEKFEFLIQSLIDNGQLKAKGI